MKNTTTEHRYDCAPYTLYGNWLSHVKDQIYIVIHDLQAAIYMSEHNKVIYITDDEESAEQFESIVIDNPYYGKDDGVYLIKQDWISELNRILDKWVKDMKKKFDCCIMNPPYSQPSAGVPNNIEFNIISTLWKYVDGEIVALFPVNKNNLMKFKFKEFLKTIDTLDDYRKYFKCAPRKTISINVFDTKNKCDKIEEFNELDVYTNIRKKLLKYSEGVLDFNMALYFRMIEKNLKPKEEKKVKRLENDFFPVYKKCNIIIENGYYLTFSKWPGQIDTYETRQVTMEECKSHKNENTFTVGIFKTQADLDSVLRFKDSKLFKYINHEKYIGSAVCYRLLNFDWNSDEDIYNGIGLTEEERNVIESM